MNTSTPSSKAHKTTETPAGVRREWRRPILRKIDALDASQMKTRARHDSLHLS